MDTELVTDLALNRAGWGLRFFSASCWSVRARSVSEGEGRGGGAGDGELAGAWPNSHPGSNFSAERSGSKIARMRTHLGDLLRAYVSGAGRSTAASRRSAQAS